VQSRLAAFHELGGTIGTAVSAAFMLAIGIANLFILKAIWAAFRQIRAGRRVADEDLNALLASRGFSPASFGQCSTSFHAPGTCIR
jgi:high-affinity nickel-transport protein